MPYTPRITEEGDTRVTTDGDARVVESSTPVIEGRADLAVALNVEALGVCLRPGFSNLTLSGSASGEAYITKEGDVDWLVETTMSADTSINSESNEVELSLSGAVSRAEPIWDGYAEDVNFVVTDIGMFAADRLVDGAANLNISCDISIGDTTLVFRPVVDLSVDTELSAIEANMSMNDDIDLSFEFDIQFDGKRERFTNSSMDVSLEVSADVRKTMHGDEDLSFVSSINAIPAWTGYSNADLVAGVTVSTGEVMLLPAEYSTSIATITLLAAERIVWGEVDAILTGYMIGEAERVTMASADLELPVSMVAVSNMDMLEQSNFDTELQLADVPYTVSMTLVSDHVFESELDISAMLGYFYAHEFDTTLNIQMTADGESYLAGEANLHIATTDILAAERLTLGEAALSAELVLDAYAEDVYIAAEASLSLESDLDIGATTMLLAGDSDMDIVATLVPPGSQSTMRNDQFFFTELNMDAHGWLTMPNSTQLSISTSMFAHGRTIGYLSHSFAIESDLDQDGDFDANLQSSLNVTATFDNEYDFTPFVSDISANVSGSWVTPTVSVKFGNDWVPALGVYRKFGETWRRIG